MKTSIYPLLAASAIALSVSSCGIYNKYHVDDVDSDLVKEYAEALKARPDSQAFGNLQWQQVFTDPVLGEMIAQALDNNTDLRNAKLNVDIAQAQLKGSKLAYFPSVALGPQGQGSSFDGSKMSWSYNLPMAVSWEVDVFGKLLNAKRGAQAALYQSQAYSQAVRSQIVGAVATTYYSIASIEAQLKLQRETAVLWKETVQTMRDSKEAGRVTEVAVEQSQAQYNGILASITDLEASLVQLDNTMSLLLNVMPQSWTIPAASTLLPAPIMREAIPMRELAARPDVRAAEQSLATAFYATNSARAAFYPTLNIDATGGFTNSAGSMIINPGKFFANLAAGLTAPLFSRGKNIATLEAAKAKQQQALNTFEYTLMSAASDVSNAMTVYGKSVEKRQYLDQQVDNLGKAVSDTKDLLAIGYNGISYLDVLTAQQNLLSAQMGQITCYLTASKALINLYQSLGGGR